MSHVLGASAGLDEAWVKDVFVPTVQKVQFLRGFIESNKISREERL